MALLERHGRNSRDDLDDIVEAVMAGAGQDLPHAQTMPASAYTSEAFYALEVEKIMRVGWLPVGHVAQIPNVGDYFTFDILNELLMVVRGPDRIRVMSRVCLHRWAPVATGQGNTKLFSCPFHRWGYGLDGTLVVAPLMEQTADLDISTCKLPEIRTEIINGTILINLSGTAAPACELLADWVETMAPYKPEELMLAYSVEFDMAFNWKIAVETFMEAYHHMGAHAQTAEPSFPAKLHEVDDTREGWTAVHGKLKPELPTSAALSGLPPFPHLSEEQQRILTCQLIYPAHCLMLAADRIHWTALVPMGVNKTRWVRHVLVPAAAKAHPDFDQIVGELRTAGVTITEEDMAVNGMQQIGASSSYAFPGRLCYLEKPTWQLTEYVREKLTA